jgi:hypothetical protein
MMGTISEGIRSEAPGISDVEVMRLAHQKKRIILLRIPRKSPDEVAAYIREVVRSRQD